ncbi:MAG TPA: APC family permease [Candidatus Limnocylindrales bacterium]|nr:APC family permease [Candidatus Limnocylindrales bacterium]
MIGGRRPLHGRKPADRRVRVERPHAPYFRYTGPGQLVAKPAASRPKTPLGRTIARIKQAMLGRPLASEEEIGERLSKKHALAIFSSDAISSSAYATEEIIRAFVLLGVGMAALTYSIPISVAIAGLLAVVAFSYRQICFAYPTGGGSYSVSKANFGKIASLVAASALLIDYSLTVAVSTSSAVEQITSAIPAVGPVSIQVAIAAIVLIAIGNLRGLRESGNIFAIPTYLFLGSALLMIAIGTFKIVVLGESRPPSPEQVAALTGTSQAVGVLILLRAFAAGAVALTGTEAIATGVPAFKPPESKNAATTLMAMAGLLAVLFIGITFLATNFSIFPIDEPAKQTVVAQVASAVYGGDSIGFYLFQAFTALLLFLAANTSFAAFPRLAAVLASDGFIPRQFAFRGDRLAFSAGIIILAVIAGSLIIIFGGHTHALIPLYAVGVFIDFTISQSGMVRHWLRTRSRGWRYRLAINAVGAVLTGIVAIVVTSVKFVDGAYLVVILIPVLVSIMLFINRQYSASKRELAVRPDLVVGPPHREARAVVPIPGLNRAVVQAINVARSVADDVRAVFISVDSEEGDLMRADWERHVPGVPLVIVESPYRALVGPLEAYLNVLDAAWPPDKESPVTFIVLPEYVARRWWERILYNQSVKRLRSVLLGRPHTVVVNVPYRREDPQPAGRADGPEPGRG